MSLVLNIQFTSINLHAKRKQQKKQHLLEKFPTGAFVINFMLQ